MAWEGEWGTKTGPQEGKDGAGRKGQGIWDTEGVGERGSRHRERVEGMEKSSPLLWNVQEYRDGYEEGVSGRGRG